MTEQHALLATILSLIPPIRMEDTGRRVKDHIGLMFKLDQASLETTLS